MGQRRRRVRVAPIAIDKAGHRRRTVAGTERDGESAAVVLKLRFAIAVPDDDQLRSFVSGSRVGKLGPHAVDDRGRPLGERYGPAGLRNVGSHGRKIQRTRGRRFARVRFPRAL
jgi:hypothetical protein